MGLFSRGKSKDRPDTDDVDAGSPTTSTDALAADGADDADARRARVSARLDRSEVDDDTDYLNLGAIWLRGSRAWSCASRSTSRSSRSPA